MKTASKISYCKPCKMPLKNFDEIEAHASCVDSTDDLIDEYEKWQKEQGLNLGSADEHLEDDSLTKTQQTYLVEFCKRWDKATDFEREQESESDNEHAPQLVARGQNIFYEYGYNGMTSGRLMAECKNSKEAAFIVCAVASHQDLLASLKEYKEASLNRRTVTLGMARRSSDAIEKAQSR